MAQNVRDQVAERVLSVIEVARRLGLSPSSVRILIHTRQLPASRISPRRLAVKESDLVDYVDTRRI